MKIFLLPLIFASSGLQLTGSARHFDFDGFDTSSPVFLDNPALERCLGSTEKGSCALSRKFIGDVEIYGGIVEVRRGRLYSLQFSGNNRNFNRIVETLSAKYGSPTSRIVANANGGGYVRAVEWRFDDGVLGLSSDTKDSSFYVGFFNSNNVDPKVPPKINF